MVPVANIEEVKAGGRGLSTRDLYGETYRRIALHTVLDSRIMKLLEALGRRDLDNYLDHSASTFIYMVMGNNRELIPKLEKTMTIL